jgi:RNA polymerase sigma-70 factor (ECF subfamily)
MTNQKQKGDMDDNGWLIARFEENRPRLRGMAYRMLGSASEAEDAVQETWLRLTRSDASTVENLGGWLTTVVSRICLDMLRSRKTRAEEPMVLPVAERAALRGPGADPEGEAVLADSIGVALLVVLNTLTPAERLAFVLHDLFAVAFDQVGPILGRTPDAAKQLASRARRRVRGAPLPAAADRARQRELLEAFLRAAQSGDLQGLLALLDPGAVLRIDAVSRVDGVVRVDVAPGDVGRPRELTGAAMWAPQFIALSRGLRPGFVQTALIDGAVGLILAPQGKLARALTFTYANSTITRIESIGDPARLRALDIAVL